MPRVDWHISGLRGGVFLLVAAFIVVLDQLSKSWVRAHLLPGESLPEIGFIRLTYVQNTGSAFGLFVNQAFLLSLVAIVGLVIILLLFRYLSKANIWAILALGLVFGGAVGNEIDRFSRGFVTDFIHVRLWHDFYWPAFNVADSAITVGVIALICFVFVGLKKEDGHHTEARN